MSGEAGSNGRKRVANLTFSLIENNLENVLEKFWSRGDFDGSARFNL
jgi:hypothetical protein